MPITEIPPSPSSPSSLPPEPPLRRRRARYEELDPEELFHVIDDLEGSKTRGPIREFLWVSIIIHMIVFWYLAYGPRFFHRVRVVDQSELLKQQQKQFTYLDTPETLKKLKPKNPAIESRNPRKNQKALEEMRRADPPKPQPQPQPPAPQVAQQQAPPPPVQPL